MKDESHLLVAPAQRLAHDWAVGTVRELTRTGALPAYDGVPLGPVLSCWLYYQLLPEALACLKLIHALDATARPVEAVAESGMSEALFKCLLDQRGVRHRVRRRGGARQSVFQCFKPLLRAGRDATRWLAGRQAPRSRPDSPRVLFLAHHPTVRPRVRSIFTEFKRRGWELTVLNSEAGSAVESGIDTRELFYRDFPPDSAAIARLYRYLGSFWYRTAGKRIRDLDGRVALPAHVWRPFVRDLLYVVLTDMEVLSRALNEISPSVLMYTSRGGLGTVAYGAGRRCGVPTVLVQITESFWDDEFRYCQADLFTVMGEAPKQRLQEMGIAPAERVVVTGSDHYAIERRTTREDARAKLSADLGLDVTRPEHRIVLFASQPEYVQNPADYRLLVLDSVIAAVNALPDTRLVVKLHPREADIGVAGRCGRHLEPGRFAVTKDNDLNVLFDASDAVVIQWSTVGLEAVARRKPVVVINFNGKTIVPCAAEGAALYADDPDGLVDALRSVLSDEVAREHLRRNSERFLRRHLSLNDGRAAVRIVDAAEQLVPISRRAPSVQWGR